MARKSFGKGAMLNPVPVVMVTSGHGKSNVFTVAWTGIVNSDPPMTYISVRKERFSHHLIDETGEFVINLVDENLAFACDYCGVKSGRDMDKFEKCGIHREKSEVVGCDSIAESPVSIECRVREKKELGSHDMFLADIVAVTARDDLVDSKNAIRLDKAGLVAYNHGQYFGLKREPIGRFGYSVMKPKTRRRINREKRTGK